MRVLLQQFAVDAYVGRGSPPEPIGWLGADDVIDARRRAHILNVASAPQQTAIAEFEALREDLERDRARLDTVASEARELVEAMRSEEARLHAELVAAQEARTELEARLAREEARGRAEQARRLALRRARSTTTTAVTVTTTTTAAPAPSPPSAPPPAPAPAPDRAGPPPSGGGAGIACPIRGAVSFVDSWGAPRSGGRRHQGVDLMAVAGTPNVAVVAGEIRHKEGRLSGLGVYLYGDDGNSYWYFHLSAYEGPPRRVARGEVVGYVGSTGNADVSAPHTHFEYHPGGGAAVNPYPLVRAAC